MILLDQFTRTIFRDTADAFAGNARASPLSLDALARTFEKSLRPAETYFLLMPLMHAEDRERCEQGSAFACRQRDVIERFGRFPSRNAALGRETTAEEAAFLAENGPGFQGRPRG